MNGARPLFFIALGLFGLYAVEFATSLYVSAANLGVVLGAAVGGGLIEAFGVQATVWSGWLFAALASAAVLARRP